MTVKDIYDYIDSIAPFSSAEPWDNVGLLIGNMQAEVSRVVVALDCTTASIDAAVANDAQLIITHHPVIFDPLKSIPADSAPWFLIKGNISVLSAHTNLDKAESGVNTAFCRRLRLPFFDPCPTNPYLLIAELTSPKSFEEFVERTKRNLRVESVRALKSLEQVKKVAVCCGSGGDFLNDAYLAGCDTFVTGDIKHHVFVEADFKGMNLIDPGHFATEEVIVRRLTTKIKSKFPELEIFPVSSRTFSNI